MRWFFFSPVFMVEMLLIYMIVCGLFEWRWIYVSFFHCLFISFKSGEDSINRVNLVTFSCLTQVNSMPHVVVFVFNHLMLKGWLFVLSPWYWWNCRPSLFKLSFHNQLYFAEFQTDLIPQQNFFLFLHYIYILYLNLFKC